VRNATSRAKLEIRNLAVGFSNRIVQRDLSFNVHEGSIFAVIGGSGCGKSTVVKTLIGLLRPLNGTVRVDGEDYWAAGETRRAQIGRRFGVLFQAGALWSSMTVAENIALPLRMFTRLDEASINLLVRLKLALVDLGNAGEHMPSELSGGMSKRAGLGRALSLDPDLLFFDEPSAGLDPVSSRRLDKLILDLRDGLGTTIVLVSHELPSLLAIADDGVFLDAETQTALAYGSPRDLRQFSSHPAIQSFMHRGPDNVSDHARA
jgi:phospholipid/cholesterol/gamma-HCH transport system ATP-binding protein